VGELLDKLFEMKSHLVHAADFIVLRDETRQLMDKAAFKL
jgi:hypothetical protein